MAHPPVYHRDRALRRLSLVTKGLAVSAIFATGGIVAAIAQATPAPKAKPPANQPAAPGAAVPRDTATTPASRGRGRVPVSPTATRAPGGRVGVPARTATTAPAPPPAPPTDPSSEPPAAVPEPTDSGGS